MTEVDAVLGGLRAQWQTAHKEAQAILDNPGSSGTLLIKAEKLFEERDRIGALIDERKDDLSRKQNLLGKFNDGESWSREPQRSLPFANGETKSTVNDTQPNQFRYIGSERAGQVDMQWNPQRKHWEMVAESGPGTHGEKQWQLLNSFEYKRDFSLMLKAGVRASYVIDISKKTLQEGLDDQGGVFAPAELSQRIIGRLPAPTVLRGMVTTVTTGRDTLIMPRKQYSADSIYTTAFRPTWTGEIPSDGTGNLATVNDANLLGNIEIPVHTAMLTAPVTRNLIEDSAFPIQAWLEAELAQTIDILYEDMIINGSTNIVTVPGNPAAQPIGILFNALAGNGEGNVYPEVILSATAGGIDYNSLVACQGALAPQYEDDMYTAWVMQKRSTYVALEQLVDSNKRPLFTTGYNDSGIVERRGRRLLGDRVILSQLMPAMSSTAFPIIYGDLRGYYIAQRVGFSIQVLDQTKAKANQIELVGRIRFGGRPIEPFRLKILKSNNS